jgi:type IV secretory pathway VirJ component
MENNALGQKVFKVIIPLVAVAALVVAGYFYNQVRVLKQDPQLAAQKEAEALVAKVGKLIVLPVLPEGENPTVATVSDPEALKDQPFFASAAAGDKVLIYTTAKKAILYSVTLNKILEVAPLNIGEGQKASAKTPTTGN